MLLGILYISDATFQFDEVLLEELAEQASEKNERLGVTGYLYYDQKQFLQYFEGSPEMVISLMLTIEKDIRHQVIKKLVDRDLRKRRFPNWNMRWVRRSEMQIINLEHLLLDQMNRRACMDQVMWSMTIWRIVDSLSELHRRMKEAAGPINYTNLRAVR